MDGLFFLKDFAAQSGLSWVRFAQMASFGVTRGFLRWKWGYLGSFGNGVWWASLGSFCAFSLVGAVWHSLAQFGTGWHLADLIGGYLVFKERGRGCDERSLPLTCESALWRSVLRNKSWKSSFLKGECCIYFYFCVLGCCAPGVRLAHGGACHEAVGMVIKLESL